MKKHPFLFSLNNRPSCLNQAETDNESMEHRCSVLINRKQFFLSPPSANHWPNPSFLLNMFWKLPAVCSSVQFVCGVNSGTQVLSNTLIDKSLYNSIVFPSPPWERGKILKQQLKGTWWPAFRKRPPRRLTAHGFLPGLQWVFNKGQDTSHALTEQQFTSSTLGKLMQLVTMLPRLATMLLHICQ